MRRFVFLTMGLLIFNLTSISQIEKRNFFPTPNSASLGTFGQIPVNLFNGLPEITIPIYEFKSRDLKIPISLSYHATGIKPGDHSSWVGLGWNLFAGGSITRIQNDLPDEFVDYENVGTGTFINREKKGFFYCYNYLGNDNWLTSTFNKEADAVFLVGINNSDWSKENIIYRRDYSPDEFQFNFLGYSGSFFMAQDGKWQIKSKQGENYNIQLLLGSYSFQEPTGNPNSQTLIRSCITGFVITTSDGAKYTFGNTDKSIEFNRIGRGTINVAPSSRDGGTIPKTWQLTKIKSQTGDEIILNYTRDGYQIMNSVSSNGYTYSCPSCSQQNNYSMNPQNDNVSILSGVTLSSISGANGTVEFVKQRITNVLDYTISGGNGSGLNAWTDLRESYYNEVFYGDNFNYPKSYYYKLNEIKVKDQLNNYLKIYSFSYTENLNNRFFLNSLAEKSADGMIHSPYKFQYNDLAGLENIPYETLKVDHWGYYNGVDPLGNITFPNPPPYGGYSPSIFDNALSTTYSANRSPIESNTKKGVLEQITYPTGGNSRFIWEPNKYSKFIDQTPINGQLNISVADLNAVKIGPGLRIKKIENRTSQDGVPITKEYLYHIDYVNQSNFNSSGVLNSAEPKYVDSYSDGSSYLYRVWSSNTRIPLHYTNGSPITYSRVQELNGDGSFKEYIYSNHDNVGKDIIPEKALTTVYGSSLFQDYNTNSKELERGLLLEENFYKPNFLRLKKVSYQYNDDQARINNNIRRYIYENKFTLNGTIIDWQTSAFSTGNPIFTGANLWALRIYTYYPHLKKRIETEYDQYGLNPKAITTDYTYDVFRNVKTESNVSSKNEVLLKTFAYSTDNIAGLAQENSNTKDLMKSSAYNMINTPLEITTSRNGIILQKSRTNFKVFENENTYIAASNSELSNSNFPLEKVATYDNYDSRGNILQFTSRQNSLNSFEWGYNKSYPIVKIINAENTKRNYTVKIPSIVNNNLSWSPGQFYLQTVSFEHERTGTITVTVSLGGSSGPNGANMNMDYTLYGPETRTGTLCTSAYGSCTAGLNSSATFTNMPQGIYTLNLSLGSNYSLSTTATYSYESHYDQPMTSGIKEFYYNGFEESDETNVVSGIANSGRKYWNGASSYDVNFVKPNTKSYTIQWFSLVNGVWKLNQQTFSGSILSLSGIIDDVRIFPSDALMNTYTYDPLIGVTSQIDPNGKAIHYEYDNFQRLKNIKDFEGNIVKNYQYNYSTDCGGNCFVLKMQTFTGYNTPAYPVGVFSVNKKYIGIANNATEFISLWNSNTSNQSRGTLSASASGGFQFNFTSIANANIPPVVYGLRYYQFDLAYTVLDGVRLFNGAFVDFGDGTRMAIGNDLDINNLPANTTAFGNNFKYVIHTYPNSNPKTITVFHTEDNSNTVYDNYNNPATSLGLISNLRGALPQYTNSIGGSSYQQASMLTMNAITNWATMKDVLNFILNQGDGVNPCRNLNYAQDFMANNTKLQSIVTTGGGYYNAGYRDANFKISRLKTNWNTYFTSVQQLHISDQHWNREDISALTKLNSVLLVAGTTLNTNDIANNAPVAIPSSVIDNLINQVAAGAGQTVSGGTITIISSGTSRTAASDAAATTLIAKGWTISIY